MVQRLASQENLKAIQLFKRLNMKIVYDLDDDLWSIPPYNPAYSRIRNWIAGFEVCSSLSDMITVSTHHLRLMVMQALGKKCPPIRVVENALDFEWFQPIPDKFRKQREGKIVLGWAGTNTHTGDVKQVFSLIPELLREYPQLEFEMVGLALEEDWKKEFGDRVRQRDFIPVAEFAVHWASWQWDLSLAPLEENRFNRSKSSIKMLEAASLHIPCVASSFGEYSKFASSSRLLKKTVMASGIHDWKRKISALVSDSALRKEVGEEMYTVGKKEFDILTRLDRWKDVFQEVAS